MIIKDILDVSFCADQTKFKFIIIFLKLKNLLKDKLLEGISGGRLSSNRLASVLLDVVSKGQFFSASRRELAAYLVSNSVHKKLIGENIETPTVENVNFLDFRFLGLTLGGIKKYPVRNDSLKYGLSFLKDSKPVNCIFVGANGVGKTSIYSALEYAGMGKINSALMRGYEREIGQTTDKFKDIEENQSVFLRHSGTDTKDVSLCLFTKKKEIRLEGADFFKHSGKPEITEAFYCSDYDVRELETNKDYTKFMLKQIGLNHFYQALQLLYYLGVYVRNEQKQAEKSIWEESPEIISEPIWRLKLGIALKHSKIKGTFDTKDETLLLLKNVIEKNQDFHLIKNYTELAIKSIKDEKAMYNEKDWFSTGVIGLYQDLLCLLENFQKNNYSFENSTKKYNLLQDLDKFISFRILLISQINQLKKELKNNKDNKIIEDIATTHKSLIGNNESEGLFATETEAKQFENEYYELITYLEDFLKNIFQKWEGKIKSFIETLLSDYFDIDNDKLVVNLEISHSKGVLELIDGVTNEMEHIDIHQFVKFDVNIMTARGNLTSDKRFPIKPRQYLNTFRFKLFCVAVKIALGCVVKEIYAINYPFIIDDIFDSSDFNNRLQLKQFVESIIKCHDELLKDNKYSMQLIFFTQDDLIANQINKGLMASKGEQNVKFGRIYDYHETNDSDIKPLVALRSDNVLKTDNSQSRSNNDRINKYISLEDDVI